MKTELRIAPSLSAVPADLVAELTVAAYGVALRHAAEGKWPDLELDLWHALTEVVSQWKLAVEPILEVCTLNSLKSVEA